MIKGEICACLPEKEYGFIKGEDGRDYFFSFSAIRDKSHIVRIAEGTWVEFEQKATPKGYRAERILVLDERILRYSEPDEVLISQGDSVKGWEFIERGEWIVHGSSRESPDDAKRELARAARHVGANALIESEYYKTTGSEQGTGKGTHHYTIHNFRARIATVGKKDMNGSLTLDDLTGLNQRAFQIKRRFTEVNRCNESENQKRRKMIWGGGAALTLILWLSGASKGVLLGAAVITMFLPVFLDEATNNGDWLLQR